MGTKSTLTSQQKDFIKSVRDSSNNLALMARAGTGKTYTLVRACDAIPENKRVLALAFNKAIADELQSRLPDHVQAMTMNSLGHRAWQRFVGNKKLSVNKDKIGNMLRSICQKQPGLWDCWAEMATLLSKARLHGLVPKGAQGEFTPMLEDTDENWASLIEEYGLEKIGEFDLDMFRKILRDSIDLAFEGSIDFDDQIYMTTIWDVPVQKFGVILVDEAQDLSTMQHRFIEKMMDEDTRLIVVGDAAQSIYAFRGSTSDSLGKLVAEYKCETYPLTVSFRCPKSVIRVAQNDVPDIEHHPDAKEGVVARLSKWDAETIENRSVILCRNVAPLVKCTYRLIAAGRPAVMAGRDIGKGLINLVNLLTKPSKNMNAVEFMGILEEWKENEINLARTAGKPYKEESVLDKYESLYAVQSYSRAKDTQGLCQGIEKLFAVGEEDKILLSTIHRAKGQEWETVYMLDDWRLPSKYAKDAVKKGLKGAAEQMQQESNLRYVAVTRAKEKLIYINSDQYISSVPEPAMPELEDGFDEDEED